MKIAISSQRPIPWRADSIGPWLNALGFLSWLGSLTTAALVFLFSGDGVAGDPWGVSAWGLLLAIFMSEHIYLSVQIAVRYLLRKLDSPGLQKDKAERFATGKTLLRETLGDKAVAAAKNPALNVSAKITREALEESARETSMKGHSSPEER